MDPKKIFLYGFFYIKFESKILWQCTSIDKQCMCIILNSLETPNNYFQDGFHNCLEKVVYTGYFLIKH